MSHAPVIDSPLIVPDGTTLIGESMTGAWLKGHVDFKSNSQFTDLKIGPASAGNSAITSASGVTATATGFTRCHFRGGGGAGNGIAAGVIVLGAGRASNNITFTDCDVECNLGTELGYPFSNSFNNIGIWQTGLAAGAYIHHITFDGCHIGVSNGVRTGSPRMGMECWVARVSEGGNGLGWSNVTVKDCVFEPTDVHNLDFADSPDGRSNTVSVTGTNFKGGGLLAAGWGYGICVEYTTQAVISGNTFGRCSDSVIYVTHNEPIPARLPATLITNNVIDAVTNNGVPLGDNPKCVLIGGYDNVFTGNTITVNYGDAVMDLRNGIDNTVTGNTFHCAAAQYTTPVKQWLGGSGNTITPNTKILDQ